jgi:chromosome partitioning protein
MGLLTFNALLYANAIVMPIGMEPMALVGARQTLDGVEQIRALWPEHTLDLAAVVPTGVNTNTHATRATLEALEQDPRLRDALFAGGIRQCIDLTYAAASGQSIWEYAPHSRGAADYTALLERIVPTASAALPTYGEIEKAQTVVQRT